MKATLITGLGLVSLALAQPHRARHLDKHEKKNLVEKDTVVKVVNTVYAVEVPEVIVYVDEDGRPVATGEGGMVGLAPTMVPGTPYTILPTSTSSSSSSSSSSSPTPYVAPTYNAPVEAIELPTTSSSSSTPVPTLTYVAPTTSSSATSAPYSAPSAPSSGGGSGYGITYTPYHNDGGCKSQQDIDTDFESIPSGYSLLRLYGCDCGGVPHVKAAAKAKGMKLMLGVFDLGSLNDEISTIVDAMSGDWDMVDTISIGNELVNSGTASAETVAAAVVAGKALLRAAGYNGNVITVDTLVAARNNPILCKVSDYCGVNSHAFYDGHTLAKDSGDFLLTQIPTLAAVLSDPNQRIVITETGWPWKGQTNGVAVPSPENQAASISSIKAAFANNPAGVILFTPFNDMWKSNTPAQFEAEQNWGLFGNSPTN